MVDSIYKITLVCLHGKTQHQKAYMEPDVCVNIQRYSILKVTPKTITFTTENGKNRVRQSKITVISRLANVGWVVYLHNPTKEVIKETLLTLQQRALENVTTEVEYLKRIQDKISSANMEEEYESIFGITK